MRKAFLAALAFAAACSTAACSHVTVKATFTYPQTNGAEK